MSHVNPKKRAGAQPRAKASAAQALATHERICSTVDSIPAGKVASYGQVAAEAGLPRRARLVGRVLAGRDEATELPWHRVVNASGGISVRDGGEAEQRRRLRSEGVEFQTNGRIDLKRFGWKP